MYVCIYVNILKIVSNTIKYNCCYYFLNYWGEKIKITKTATINVKKKTKQHIIFIYFNTIISTERNVSFSSRHLECF